MATHSSEDFIYHLGNKLKEYQNSDGSIICKDDQTHDHWDHLEACIGLGIAGFKDEFESNGPCGYECGRWRGARAYHEEPVCADLQQIQI